MYNVYYFIKNLGSFYYTVLAFHFNKKINNHINSIAFDVSVWYLYATIKNKLLPFDNWL